MDQIRPFQPGDQDAVRALVLSGLAEHFANLDPALNPDLRDIRRSFLSAGGVFLVVERADRIVACGGLRVQAGGAGRLARLSVAADCRRQGLATAVIERLLADARARDLRRIVVETNADWQAAVGLYVRLGFALVRTVNGEHHFQVYL